MRLAGTQSRSGRFGKEKIFFPLPGLEPHFVQAVEILILREQFVLAKDANKMKTSVVEDVTLCSWHSGSNVSRGLAFSIFKVEESN
jgi:hypothetical protein